MSWLSRLFRATVLLTAAVASFLVTVPGTGCLLCLGYESLEARAALRKADALERLGRPDKAEDRHRYADDRRQRTWEDCALGGAGLIALIAVAGGLGIGLAWGRRGEGEPGAGSSGRYAGARRACAGLLTAILVGMGAGVLAYFGLGYYLVFVLDD